MRGKRVWHPTFAYHVVLEGDGGLFIEDRYYLIKHGGEWLLLGLDTPWVQVSDDWRRLARNAFDPFSPVCLLPFTLAAPADTMRESARLIELEVRVWERLVPWLQRYADKKGLRIFGRLRELQSWLKAVAKAGEGSK